MKHNPTELEIAAPQRAGGQVGSTLIEILVAMAIMAVVMGGILTGYFTTVRVSGVLGQSGATQSAFGTVADKIGNMPYRKCATLTQVNSDLTAMGVPTGFAVSVAQIRYLGTKTSNFVDGPCSTDRGAQLLTVRVAAAAPGAVAVSGQLVIRDPQARSS